MSSFCFLSTVTQRQPVLQVPRAVQHTKLLDWAISWVRATPRELNGKVIEGYVLFFFRVSKCIWVLLFIRIVTACVNCKTCRCYASVFTALSVSWLDEQSPFCSILTTYCKQIQLLRGNNTVSFNFTVAMTLQIYNNLIFLQILQEGKYVQRKM